MTRDSDSLYHTEQALKHLDEVIDNLQVPLFAFEHDAAAGDVTAQTQFILARAIDQHLIHARESLTDLRNRLISP